MIFLSISAFHPQVEWVEELNLPHLIYNKSGKDLSNQELNVEVLPNVGYNMYDICHFIETHYENLPEITVFCKSNVFPRHVSKEFFLNSIKSVEFHGIFDKTLHHPYLPICKFSEKGYWEELNTSWYMGEGNPYKYYNNFNMFFQDFFEGTPPTYVEFTPGGNFVVPKENILKHSKIFYQNLKKIVSHDTLSAESFLVERSIHGVFSGKYLSSQKMNNHLL